MDDFAFALYLLRVLAPLCGFSFLAWLLSLSWLFDIFFVPLCILVWICEATILIAVAKFFRRMKGMKFSSAKANDLKEELEHMTWWADALVGKFKSEEGYWYAHRWRRGDLVITDNLAVAHRGH